MAMALRVALPESAANDADIHEGDTVRIAGILGKTQTGFRVLARNGADVTILKRAIVQDASAILPAEPLRQSMEIGITIAVIGAIILASVWRRLRARKQLAAIALRA